MVSKSGTSRTLFTNILKSISFPFNDSEYWVLFLFSQKNCQPEWCSGKSQITMHSGIWSNNYLPSTIHSRELVFWKFEISWKNKNDFAGKTLTFLNQDICSFPSISYPFRAWRPLKGHPYLNKFPFFTGNQALNNYMSSMTIYAKETVYPRHHFFARFVVAV